MRHRVKKGPKFNRPIDHRRLMLRNLSTSLILHEQMKTTLAKGKETVRLIDRLILIGRQDPLTARRHLSSFLLDRQAVDKIIEVIAKADPKRQSGFVRTVRLPNRLGDNAPMIQLELILPASLKEVVPAEEKKTKVKTRIVKKSKIQPKTEDEEVKRSFFNRLKVRTGRPGQTKTKVATRTTNK